MRYIGCLYIEHRTLPIQRDTHVTNKLTGLFLKPSKNITHQISSFHLGNLVFYLATCPDIEYTINITIDITKKQN